MIEHAVSIVSGYNRWILTDLDSKVNLFLRTSRYNNEHRY